MNRELLGELIREARIRRDMTISDVVAKYDDVTKLPDTPRGVAFRESVRRDYESELESIEEGTSDLSGLRGRVMDFVIALNIYSPEVDFIFAAMGVIDNSLQAFLLGHPEKWEEIRKMLRDSR